MEERRLVFITINNTKDEQASPELLAEMIRYQQWLKNKVDERTIIYSSPSFECVQCANILHDSLTRPFKVVRNLNEGKTGVERIKLEHKITEEYVPKFNSIKDKDKFIVFLKQREGNSVVVIDANVFQEFQLDKKTRAHKLSAMHEVTVTNNTNEDRIGNTRTEMAKVAEYLKEDLREALREKLPPIFEQDGLFEDIRDSFRIITKSLIEIFSILKLPSKKAETLNRNMTSIEKVIECGKKQIAEIHKTISNYEDLSLSNRPEFPGDHAVEIKCFFYDIESKHWVLKIRSCSDLLVGNFCVYIIESGELLCKIKSLQKNTTLTRRIPSPYTNLHFSHLIATFEENPISPPFYIIPFKISIDEGSNSFEANTNLASVTVNIFKSAQEIYQDINLVSSISNIPAIIDSQRLIYNQSTKEQFIFPCSSESSSLFLVYGTKIISNILLYTRASS